MTTTDLQAALSLEALTQSGDVRQITDWYVGDLLSHVMGRVGHGNAWVTIQNNLNVVAVAKLTGVACVILAEGVEISPAVIARAEEQGVILYRSPLTAYELLCRVQALS
jgi:hypothetical protein